MRLPPWFGAALAITLLVAGTAFTQPSFLKVQNLLNIANEQASVGIVAIGMTIVIVAGGIDLSVGSLLVLAGGVGIVTLNWLSGHHFSDVVAVLGCAAVVILVGLLSGFCNGLLISKGRVAPFIATLGALLAYRSAAQWMANGGNFPVDQTPMFATIGQGVPIPHTNTNPYAFKTKEEIAAMTPRQTRFYLAHKDIVSPMMVPTGVIAWIVLAIAGSVLLNRTRLGRYIIAVGNNPRAAMYSAIPVDRVKIFTYLFLGVLVGIAAFIESARYNSVSTGTTGLFLELYAIAAAVIGGSRIEGGVGSIAGAVIGALLLGVIKNVMVMLNINAHAQGLAMGLIIIVAALVQRLRK